jgi:hypothetical protein
MVGEALRKDQFNDTVRPGGQAYEDIAITDRARWLDPNGPRTRQEQGFGSLVGCSLSHTSSSAWSFQYASRSLQRVTVMDLLPSGIS